MNRRQFLRNPMVVAATDTTEQALHTAPFMRGDRRTPPILPA